MLPDSFPEMQVPFIQIQSLVKPLYFRHIHIVCLICLLPIALSACAKPSFYPQGSRNMAVQLHADFAEMNDGYRLPLRHWGTPENDKAIILALHGLNDYGAGFETTGRYLESQGISLISYDQRGFGASAGAGYWHGSQRMIKDNLDMLHILRQRYPDKPLFLLGESMGGAIALASLNQLDIEIDGTILLAPAIWSRQSMPWYQRSLLWLAVHTVPAKELTGEGLDIQASDNIGMLRALGSDPLVIKSTRVDVLYGVTNLMDIAAKASIDFSQKSLIMYGKHDDIVPRKPTCSWLKSLPVTDLNNRDILIYEYGYHMLNRDLQANQVLDDIAGWVLGLEIRNNDRVSIQKKHQNQQDIYISLEKFCDA
jgi:acylglycerol lipase